MSVIYRWQHAIPGSTKHRSYLTAPLVIRDDMEPVQSMLDGKMYTSKSALRATYRRAGVDEIGNDPARHQKFKRKTIDKKAVRTSIEKARAKLERREFTTETKQKLA